MSTALLRNLSHRSFPLRSSSSISRQLCSGTDATIIYKNPRKGQALAMTALAVGQAGFWASAAVLGASVPEPILSPGWTVAGFGLSAAFGTMINVYLRRNVAEISLIDGPAIKVITHSFGGFLGKPALVKAADIIPGPNADKQSERYWTFGVKRGEHKSNYFYIVDRNNGVQDIDGLAALARGGDHLMVYAHKRYAGRMQHRWDQWKHGSIKQT